MNYQKAYRHSPKNAVIIANGANAAIEARKFDLAKAWVDRATGAMNDDEVVIARGLAEGDRVLLTLPPGHEKLKLARLPAADAAKPASVTAGATTPPPTPPANQD